MPQSRGRILGIVIGGAVVFLLVAGILIQILPKPLKPIDYMVVGSVATLIALVVAFFIVIAVWLRSPDVFLKRRKPPDGTSQESDRISTP